MESGNARAGSRKRPGYAGSSLQSTHRRGIPSIPGHGFSEALQLSGKHPDIGLVVVDLHTCVRLSGVEMAGEMRQRLNNSHYILTSSDWDALGPACPDDMTMLRKPYGKVELLRAVRRGVARRKERRRFSVPKRPNRRRA